MTSKLGVPDQGVLSHFGHLDDDRCISSGSS